MSETGIIVSMDAAVSVAEQTRGLDWAHWLLRSVRQRCEGVLLQKGEGKAVMHQHWRLFVRERFLPLLAPSLIRAWQLADARDVHGVLQLEQGLASQLSSDEQARAILAGRVLLARTHGARYQGTLGHYRAAVEEGRADGHVLAVWPSVAQLFQLTPVAMLAEYLRLEWETATRDLPGVALPQGSYAIGKLAAAALSGLQAELRLVDRKEA